MRAGRLAGLVLLPLAACARPTGDFGRAAPSVVHDAALPIVGRVVADARGEPVSGFTTTADEQRLRDRGWRFLVPARAGLVDASLAELERTRVLPATGLAYDAEDYYRSLRGGAFASDVARYNRLIADMNADAALLPGFDEVACRVLAADRERLGAAGRIPGLEADFVANARARVAENSAFIAAVGAALRARVVAYRYAIDHLEVESPTDRLFEANGAWSDLTGVIGALRCGAGPAPTAPEGVVEPVPPPAPETPERVIYYKL